MSREPARKAFTVDEANALLPVLEGVLDALAGLREELEQREEQVQILDALWGSKVLEKANPDHKELLAHRNAARGLAARMRGLIEGEIVARGVRFPAGGLEHGLLDFPTTLDGRWVYLCWHRGEERVSQWHEVHAGFAGRRDIGPAEAARMGTEDDPGTVDDSVLDF